MRFRDCGFYNEQINERYTSIEDLPDEVGHNSIDDLPDEIIIRKKDDNKEDK